MKLNVLIFSDENIENLDNIPDKHYMWHIIRSSSANNFSKLSQLIRKYKPVALCLTKKTYIESIINKLPYEYTKRLIIINSLKDITSALIEEKYINASITDRFSKNNPLFSVITTTFHSGNKIFRPYESLKSQTYSNWEWVIWDDSKEDHIDTWNQLLKFQEEDIRIQCYRATQHSGYIGEMKWRSAALSKGEWIVEIDHDDIVDPQLFEWCIEATKKHPDADFICSSCVELYEDNEETFSYGDFTAYGYASYYKKWLRGKWHNVYNVPHVNPKTVRHIVGAPNHVRIWRRTFYEKIGKHNQDFPVTDDYELIVRSVINGKWIFIDAPTYFQYRNANGNNFTFLRNSLIQHLKDKVRDVYAEEVDAYWKSKNISNKYSDVFKAWERSSDFTYDKGYVTYTPNTSSNTVSIIMTVENETELDIIKTVNSIISQTHTDWLLFIIGNKSLTLNKCMNTVRKIYNDSIINKIRWWNLETKLSRQVSLNYAHRMLINTEWISYIQVNTVWDSNFLSNSMEQIKTNNLQLISNNSSTLYNTVHRFDLLTICDELSDKSVKLITG
jgi:glycosyltransferase involved in cell wall biosynthesis